jgi:hypothetical protein
MLGLVLRRGPEVGPIGVLSYAEVGRELSRWVRPPWRVGLLFPGDVSF